MPSEVTVYLGVWAQDGTSGAYELVQANPVLVPGAFTGWPTLVGSGSLNVPIEAGNGYLVGGWWAESVQVSYVTEEPEDPDWGTFESGVWRGHNSLPQSSSNLNMTTGQLRMTLVQIDEADGDGDGVDGCEDCDNLNDEISPDLPEACDGVDNDCNGSPDADPGGEVDGDVDGCLSCDDCDDTDAAINADAVEVCDGVDNNCDGAFLASDNWVTSSPGSTSRGAGYMQGNVTQATEDTILHRFRQRVSVGVGGEVTLAVYEGESALGPWVLQATVPIVSTASGNFWADTGNINVPVTTGSYYATVAWLPDGGSYRHAGPVGNYSDGGFGTVVGAVQMVVDDVAVRIEESVATSNAMHTRTYWGREADADGDGVSTCEGDCDDDDATVQPGGAEVCDGADNDCAYGADDIRIRLDSVETRTVNNLNTGGTNIEVDAFGTVAEVNVRFDVSMTQTYYNTRVRLRSPAGTLVTLRGAASDGSSVDSRFDDEASQGLGGGSPFTGTQRPVGTLDDFAGEEANGTWTLQLFHQAVHGPATIENWTLELTLASADAGSTSACAAASCQDILEADPQASDGIYWLEDIDTGARYQTLCDMQNDGGGWTLAANVSDASDPYFGGHSAPFFDTEWIEAWESDSTRNVDSIPTFNNSSTTSSKYRAFSDLPVNDVRIHYSLVDAFFLCEGLDTRRKLHEVFSMTPAQDECNATCTSWSQSRFLTELATGDAGLNCSDGNEPWWVTDQNAENARIGARADNTRMDGFLGTMGDRNFLTSQWEKTWGGNSEGAAFEDYVLLFVS